MKTLQELINAQLPLNRKEVFFTATVFPMIIAKDNFRHLPLLLQELGISSVPEIIVQPEQTNILFFSEYNLSRALNGSGRKQIFQDNEESLPEDTPDVMILIDAPDNKILIALEAKMYTKFSGADLEIQMDKQKRMLDIVKVKLAIQDKDCYHFALLPEDSLKNIGEIKYRFITWEKICELYDKPEVAKDDYFMTMLKIALESYKTLASSFEPSYGKNNERTMSGQEIYDAFKKNPLETQSMGRDGGFYGTAIKNDLEQGFWKSQRYETRKTGIPNRNWFAVADFVKKIDGKASS